MKAGALPAQPLLIHLDAQVTRSLDVGFCSVHALAPALAC